MRYQKQLVKIEAFEFRENYMKVEANCIGVPNWGISAYDDGVIYFDDKDDCFIKTPEGDNRVSVGDYIIRDINGELYSCKPCIFNKYFLQVN